MMVVVSPRRIVVLTRRSAIAKVALSAQLIYLGAVKRVRQTPLPEMRPSVRMDKIPVGPVVILLQNVGDTGLMI
jgi:hypothetical protein